MSAHAGMRSGMEDAMVDRWTRQMVSGGMWSAAQRGMSTAALRGGGKLVAPGSPAASAARTSGIMAAPPGSAGMAGARSPGHGQDPMAGSAGMMQQQQQHDGDGHGVSLNSCTRSHSTTTHTSNTFIQGGNQVKPGVWSKVKGVFGGGRQKEKSTYAAAAAAAAPQMWDGPAGPMPGSHAARGSPGGAMQNTEAVWAQQVADQGAMHRAAMECAEGQWRRQTSDPNQQYCVGGQQYGQQYDGEQQQYSVGQYGPQQGQQQQYGVGQQFSQPQQYGQPQQQYGSHQGQQSGQQQYSVGQYGQPQGQQQYGQTHGQYGQPQGQQYGQPQQYGGSPLMAHPQHIGATLDQQAYALAGDTANMHGAQVPPAWVGAQLQAHNTEAWYKHLQASIQTQYLLSSPVVVPAPVLMDVIAQVHRSNDLLRKESTARTMGMRSIVDAINRNIAATQQIAAATGVALVGPSGMPHGAGEARSMDAYGRMERVGRQLADFAGSGTGGGGACSGAHGGGGAHGVGGGGGVREGEWAPPLPPHAVVSDTGALPGPTLQGCMDHRVVMEAA
ncbi:hypothetical protein FOA52_007462 [Chlamydomonas sp. UWO 241]|nr:hypothetical protein FOA52_007462 [Chlamydomonas sp. UWO 241]